MPLKKVDGRIRTLIENGVSLNQRSLFLVVGDKSRDQVVILHHMLSKSVVKARPSVLWCYKKELGFSRLGENGVTLYLDLCIDAYAAIARSECVSYRRS